MGASPSRASSTKTRIETFRSESNTSLRSRPSRASSTKTRIETKGPTAPEYRGQTSRASSTKTRIETIKYNSRRCSCKHQEQVPRKQGLKLFAPQRIDLGHLASRASSTKTRIETVGFRALLHADLPIKSKFHENKD